jgi:hypothetical protein
MNPPSPSTLFGEEGTQEGAKDLRREPRIPGTAVTERIGKCEDPLTHGKSWNHVIDEMGSGLRHPPSAARRTESATLAREGHEPIMSASVAMNAQESMSEHTALEIRTDLSFHEPSDGRALPSRPSQEGLELLADDFVQKGLFGFAAFVLDGGYESTETMRWGVALHAKASDVPRQVRREALGETDRSRARIRCSSHRSKGSDAEPPGSHAQRDRMDSSLLTGS